MYTYRPEGIDKEYLRKKAQHTIEYVNRLILMFVRIFGWAYALDYALFFGTITWLRLLIVAAATYCFVVWNSKQHDPYTADWLDDMSK